MRDELILDNLKLVYFTIKKMGLRDFSDDLYDIGLIGLVKAANTFDEGREFKFNTYAIRCIRNEISMYIRRMQTEHNKANLNPLSLNNVVSDDDGKEIEFIDTIPDDFNMEEYTLEKERCMMVSNAIKMLPERDRLIVRLYYGPRRMRQYEIAKLLNTTQSNISRLIIRATKRLKEIIKEKYE